MQRLLRLTAMGVISLGMAGCATMSVSSHMQPGLDLTLYHTFEWGPPDALPVGDPRLDDNSFFKDRVEGAIEKQLATRGFEHTAANPAPDLLIHYHASINTRIDIDAVDRAYGQCRDSSCAPAPIEYEAGTLILDLVDARTQQLIWRSWAQDSLKGVLENRERMGKEIDEAVRRMIARLPKPVDLGSRSGLALSSVR